MSTANKLTYAINQARDVQQDIIKNQQLGAVAAKACRADFALLLSLQSKPHLRVYSPNRIFHSQQDSEAQSDMAEADIDQDLRAYFQLAPANSVYIQEQDNLRAAQQAAYFHQAGLASTKLYSYLLPIGLVAKHPQHHHLPEEVYYNLSEQSCQALNQKAAPERVINTNIIYQNLVRSKRARELHVTVV